MANSGRVNKVGRPTVLDSIRNAFDGRALDVALLVHQAGSLQAGRRSLSGPGRYQLPEGFQDRN